MRSKRYTIVVANRSTGVTRRFTIPLSPALSIVIIVLALPLLLGLGARWSARAEVQQLKSVRGALQQQNDSYREATGQLASQISALEAAVDEIGARAAVDPAASRAMEKLPAVVRSRAMGGGGAPAVAALGSAFGSPDTAFGVLRDLLGAIEDRLDSVREGVDRRKALASATPSIWPVAGWLTSAYGTRRDPFSGGQDFHPGLDISGSYGEPVRATADGIISSAGYAGSYGNLVVIDHGFGIVTKYGHLSRFAVGGGQQVTRGDIVGYVGSTGHSTGAHLHYEIWMNGSLTNPLRLLAKP